MPIDINQANEGLRENARGAINALITVNSGAAVALLTQLGQLQALVGLQDILGAFKFWIFGVVAGLVAWFCVTVAASAHAWAQPQRERFMTYAGYVSWMIGVGCFVGGGFSLLWALG